MVIFETDRLLIRRYTLADEENFFAINGDPEIMRYIREPRDRQECLIFLKRNIQFYEQNPLMGRWAMTEKGSGSFVGSFAIIPVESADQKRHTEIQLGYALLKDHWGKGYATESTLAGRQYAFDVMKLPQIVAITEPENIASQKVLLRCGFKQQPNIREGNKYLCYFSSHNPNAIETERLHLFPLTVEQLELYLKAGDQLEKALGLTPFGRTVSQAVLNRVSQCTLPEMEKAGADYLFHTFWLVVDKQSKVIVAEMGFKGKPSAKGEVEIGYGTMPVMQNKGYMTEAVKGLLQWAASRPDIAAVLAETRADNKPSIRVLEKNGFERIDGPGVNWWWRKTTNVLMF
ncbi:GNAT family N-acetyltransferase [Longitalea arenae]|uniref:GNAT family N-acetyltransferase n=1 Tax=Longitalea arenae TaxID=2812558 RepID=UPI0019689B2D|nr:GNAT family N-acetyltransferase [Longitalea arenae]